MKILLTAFEPFDGQTSNSSLEVLNRISDADNIVKAVLPVSYDKSKEKINELIDTSNPNIVICLGQAGLANSIRLEKLAINYTRAPIADNDGVIKECDSVIKDSKEAIFTNFAIENIYKNMVELSKKKYNVRISVSAGSYICNTTYYVALKRMNGNALFIHLPYYKGQVNDTNIFQMDIDEMVDTVKYIIDMVK